MFAVFITQINQNTDKKKQKDNITNKPIPIYIDMGFIISVY